MALCRHTKWQQRVLSTMKYRVYLQQASPAGTKESAGRLQFLVYSVMYKFGRPLPTISPAPVASYARTMLDKFVPSTTTFCDQHHQLYCWEDTNNIFINNNSNNNIFINNNINMVGVLRTSGPWTDEKKSWLANGFYLEVIDGLVPGLNELHHRFTNSLAYYMPRTQAIKIMHYMRESRRKLRVVDIYLGSSPCHIQLLWPNAFAEELGTVSQCQSPYKDGGSDLYMSREMQNEMLRHGRCFQDLLNMHPHSLHAPIMFSIATPGTSPMPTPPPTPPTSPRDASLPSSSDQPPFD
jgi:hypothetical protein